MCHTQLRSFHHICLHSILSVSNDNEMTDKKKPFNQTKEYEFKLIN